MSKEITFHIGLHKTATTFLQEQIFPFANNVLFLKKPYNQVKNLSITLNSLMYEDSSFYDETILQELLESVSFDKILLSDEDLSGRTNGFGAVINRSIVAKRIKLNFPDAKIILVIRGQEDIIYSSYNQYVKGLCKGTLTVEKILMKYSQDPTDMYIHLKSFKYYELVMLYKSLFKEVLVLLYEDINNDKDKFITRLASFLNVDFFIPEKTLLGANVTPQKTHIQALRFVNRWQLLFGMNVFTKVAWRMYKYLYVPLTGKGKNDKQYIHEFVGDYYHENNRKLAELCPELELEKYKKYYPY